VGGGRGRRWSPSGRASSGCLPRVLARSPGGGRGRTPGVVIRVHLARRRGRRRAISETPDERGGAAMVWRMVIGGLLGGALLVSGCATKKFVQEEVAKSQEKTGAEVGRVDTALSTEKSRVE